MHGRIRREARTIAAVNHPSIVTIYHVEEAGGQYLLFMELIDGKSLDKNFPSKGLPLATIFDIAIPMARQDFFPNGGCDTIPWLKPASGYQEKGSGIWHRAGFFLLRIS